MAVVHRKIEMKLRKVKVNKLVLKRIWHLALIAPPPLKSLFPSIYFEMRNRGNAPFLGQTGLSFLFRVSFLWTKFLCRTFPWRIHDNLFVKLPLIGYESLWSSPSETRQRHRNYVETAGRWKHWQSSISRVISFVENDIVNLSTTQAVSVKSILM